MKTGSEPFRILYKGSMLRGKIRTHLFYQVELIASGYSQLGEC